MGIYIGNEVRSSDIEAAGKNQEGDEKRPISEEIS